MSKRGIRSKSPSKDPGPTIKELCERLKRRKPIALKESAADAVRAERDAR
jgi:hypothetical protein